MTNDFKEEVARADLRYTYEKTALARDTRPALPDEAALVEKVKHRLKGVNSRLMGYHKGMLKRFVRS